MLAFQSPYQQTIQKVGEMKRKFGILLDDADGSPPAFTQLNDLFVDLQSSFEELLAKSAELELPQCWRKVDVIREAKSLQVC